MRVSQIQNLTWAGNVLVLGGLVWVGIQFWNARPGKAKAPPDPKWDTQKAGTEGPRWPGDVSGFTHIWQTPISGKVPPPPTPPPKEQPKIDKVAEFKGKLKYFGGFEFPGQPELSTARVNFEGKDLSISPGSTLGGFQLIQFTLDDVKKTAKLVFSNPDTGAPFTVEQQQNQVPPLSDPNTPPWKRKFTQGFQEGAVAENGPLDKRSFVDPVSGDWIVPEDEQAWIWLYGEKNILSKLATRPDVDAQGVSHGVRIMGLPESGTPLAPSHGVGVGDVVRSINGEPMTSKEDIANYLRGKGKGLTKYVVVIDTNGKVRTVTYKLPRPR